ncbi:MAG: hypothetical protein KTR35_03695 [Gammaproteobacteria bacterium]|nr:hypothetical protein [Gammaproteobacteria bacterium]
MRHWITSFAIVCLFGCSDSSTQTDSALPSDDPGSNEITSNTYVSVLETSLSLLRGQGYQSFVATLQSGEAIWGAPRTQPSGTELSGSCNNDGTFKRIETYDDSVLGPNQSHRVEFEFSDCAIANTLLDGPVIVDTETEGAGQGTIVHQNYEISSVTRTQNGVLETLDATLTQTAGVFGFRQYYQVLFNTRLYQIQTGESTFEIRDANYLQSFNHEQDTDGSTTAHSFSETGSAVLLFASQTPLRGSLNLNPEFVYLNESMDVTASWRHTDHLASGELEITSIDGSKVRVSPETGNDETVNYLITSDGFQTLVEDFWFSPAQSSQLP